MSYSAAQDVREQVRQATDIVDLVGSYLELRSQGRTFVARCPWHDDRKPSLTVNRERQSWKCWVCNIGGDIFSFVMRREGVEFREALQLLADRAGIQVTAHRKQVAEPGSPDDKPTLYQAMAWAEAQFHECLLHSSEAEPARRYLAERGITADSIARFRLGYSPDQWQWLLSRARGTPHSEAVLEACDLIGRGASGQAYDRFKGRVLFPIHDLQGRAIAIGGRVLPGMSPQNTGKYINSRETRLFTKSDNLYALDIARQALSAKARRIVVVEGYTDVVISHQCGMTNVVAVLGTALNGRHIRLLKRFADTVYLVLDGDEAGQRRTNEILGLFVAEQMDLRIMTLPDQMDPADFCLARGAEAFQTLLADAVDAIEHKIRVATREIDLVHDTHQAHRALEDILSTIARAPRSISDTSSAQPLWESQILNRLARQFLIDEHEVRERFRALRQVDRPSDPSPITVPVVDTIALKTLPPKEIELLEILVLHPELAPEAFQRIAADDLQAVPAKTLFNSLRQLAEMGEPLEFQHVLTSLDDERLKGLFVQLDDDARAKAAHASEPAGLRLADLSAYFESQREDKRSRPFLALLGQGALDFQKETELLQQMFERERNRRGLTAPTEG